MVTSSEHDDQEADRLHDLGEHGRDLLQAQDLDTFMEVFQSPATADAMKYDGAKRDTVLAFVLDKRLDL